MEYEESLQKGVELLESLSLSDSRIDSEAFSLYSGLDLDFSATTCDISGSDLDLKNEKLNSRNFKEFSENISNSDFQINTFNDIQTRRQSSIETDSSTVTYSSTTTLSSAVTHSSVETNSTREILSTKETLLTCTNPVCNSKIKDFHLKIKDLEHKIKDLDVKIKLLETQNSQLIINSCSMYNTLIKHIQSLTEELNKYKN